MLGYTATNAGIAPSPRGAGASLAALVVGRLMGIVSPRTVVLFGFVLMTISLYLLGFFQVLALICLVCTPCVFFLRSPRNRGVPPRPIDESFPTRASPGPYRTGE